MTPAGNENLKHLANKWPMIVAQCILAQDSSSHPSVKDPMRDQPATYDSNPDPTHIWLCNLPTGQGKVRQAQTQTQAPSVDK